MKISLATNFDDNLIDLIKPYDVYEVYGRFKSDLLSGGRPSNSVAEISKQRFEQHVKKVRNANINFNYLFNGACTANIEQDKKWQKDFKEFIMYLKDVGVNAFTVTNPMILILLKKIYPECICRVSTFACVNTIEKAKYWEKMGADIICADFVSINRNFDLLAEMVKALKAKIEILVTNSCIKDCPYIHTHTNCISHASATIYNQDYVDWCLLKCQYHELCHKENYIKSPWVRPEDIVYYENIGIEHFKITERDFPTEILVKRLKAYSERRYDGNLLDLIQGHGFSLHNENKELVKKENFGSIKEVLDEIYKIRGFKKERMYPPHVYIDNRKLDNFIQHFINGRCNGKCSNCNYCKTVSDRVITENKEICDYLISLYKKLDEFMFEI